MKFFYFLLIASITIVACSKSSDSPKHNYRCLVDTSYGLVTTNPLNYYPLPGINHFDTLIGYDSSAYWRYRAAHPYVDDTLKISGDTIYTMTAEVDNCTVLQ